MNIYKTIVLFFLLLLSNLSKAQEAINVEFGSSFDTIEKNGHGYLLVYQLKNKTIHNFQKKYEVILPNNFLGPDTSYFKIYFEGNNKSKVNLETFCLLEHNGLGDYKVYVDHNGDLDFSNDGNFLYPKNASSFVITLKNSENKNLLFPVLLTRNYATLEDHWGIPGKQRNGATLRPNAFWFKDQRMNYKVKEFSLNGKKQRIALHDSNCNGRYNDIGEDMFLLQLDESIGLSTDIIRGGTRLSDTTLVEIENKTYLINLDNDAGTSITLSESAIPYSKPLRMGDNIEDQNILKLDSSYASLKNDFRSSKHIMLYAWGTWCAGCISQLPNILELYESHKDHLTVIGLNYGDSPNTIISYIKKNHLEWAQGYLTQELIEYFSINGYPTFILLDQKGKILFYDSHTYYINEYLDKTDNKTID